MKISIVKSILLLCSLFIVGCSTHFIKRDSAVIIRKAVYFTAGGRTLEGTYLKSSIEEKFIYQKSKGDEFFTIDIISIEQRKKIIIKLNSHKYCSVDYMLNQIGDR